MARKVYFVDFVMVRSPSSDLQHSAICQEDATQNREERPRCQEEDARRAELALVLRLLQLPAEFVI